MYCVGYQTTVINPRPLLLHLLLLQRLDIYMGTCDKIFFLNKFFGALPFIRTTILFILQ